jgi:hypothetical protein
MINKIYLDIDGVLADFRGQCEKFDCIKGTTVNWDIVHANGTEFWENIEWIEESKKFFSWLKKLCAEENIELYTLTAVRSTDGKIGRMNWMKNNLGIDKHHLLIVNLGKEKGYYADPNSVLIDDYKKNCDLFIGAGGQAIKFDTPNQTQADLLKLIGG